MIAFAVLLLAAAPTPTPTARPTATPWAPRRPPTPAVLQLAEPTPAPPDTNLSDIASQIKLKGEGGGTIVITDRTLEHRKPTKHPATHQLYVDLMRPFLVSFDGNVTRLVDAMKSVGRGTYQADSPIWQTKLHEIAAAFTRVDTEVSDIEPPQDLEPTHTAFIGCIRQFIAVTGAASTFGLEQSQETAEEAFASVDRANEKCQAVRTAIAAR